LSRIEFSEAAAEDLDRLIVTHSLPADTKERIRRSVQSLGRFPRLGVLLAHPGWEGFRFILGPWRWLVIVYDYYEDEDRVVIATLQDGRSSTAVTVSR
jgi:plasmid stabilization system protein ParE